MNEENTNRAAERCAEVSDLKRIIRSKPCDYWANKLEELVDDLEARLWAASVIWYHYGAYGTPNPPPGTKLWEMMDECHRLRIPSDRDETAVNEALAAVGLHVPRDLKRTYAA